MVQYEETLDSTFAALGDPTRRAVLERLGHGGAATISELAAPFQISLTGMRKHVRVLESAELVTTEKVGRSRRCILGPRHLEQESKWIEGYRRSLEDRLDRLGELLDRNEGERR